MLRVDSGDDLDSIVARLNAWRPQMLVAYASMLRLLATEQLAGRLTITPRFVFSASEVLTDSTRAMATRAWNTPPHNVYAATETSGIAAECGRHQGMHLFEDLVITEIVDENNQPVPPGTYGAKMLVTVLFSRTLPLIRYEMGDSVQSAPEHHCGCGRPYASIGGIQGRRQDALLFPARDPGTTRVVQPIVFHHVMDDLDTAGWQIIQRADALEVLLAHPRHVDASTLAAGLRSALTEQRVTPPAIQIRQVDAISRTPLGKAPLILAQHRPPDM